MKDIQIPNVPFYFLRHGETEWNRQRLPMGQTDISLNLTGVAQAQQAALVCLNIEVGHIVSSPLSRAQQTAKIIQSSLNVPLKIATDLQECCWGETEGIPLLEEWSAKNWIQGATPPGGETFLNFKQRVIGVVSSLLQAASSPILLVSHNAVGWVLMKVLGPQEEFDQRIHHCTPYFFNPPQKLGFPWTIKPIQ